MFAQVNCGVSNTGSSENPATPARRDSGTIKRTPTAPKEDGERGSRSAEEPPPKRFLRVEDIWV